MKRFLPSLAVFLALAACASANAVSYDLTINTNDIARQAQLISLSKKVVERRLEAMNDTFQMENVTMGVADGKATLSVKADEPTIIAALTQQLTSPFSLRVMRQTDDPDAPIKVEGHGSFEDTGLTDKHVDWAEAMVDEKSGRGMVVLSLTPEGKEVMRKVFAENVGTVIGIFVRDRLVSKKVIDKSEAKESIVISDIPKVEIATIFADDVNVGLHVTFAADREFQAAPAQTSSAPSSAPVSAETPATSSAASVPKQ